MNDRRKLVPFWVPLLFGLISLFNLVTRPSFATIRGPDVVQLIGTGMCFGVALATLVVFLRGSRSRGSERHGGRP